MRRGSSLCKSDAGSTATCSLAEYGLEPAKESFRGRSMNLYGVLRDANTKIRRCQFKCCLCMVRLVPAYQRMILSKGSIANCCNNLEPRFHQWQSDISAPSCSTLLHTRYAGRTNLNPAEIPTDIILVVAYTVRFASAGYMFISTRCIWAKLIYEG